MGLHNDKAELPRGGVAIVEMFSRKSVVSKRSPLGNRFGNNAFLRKLPLKINGKWRRRWGVCSYPIREPSANTLISLIAVVLSS